MNNRDRLDARRRDFHCRPMSIWAANKGCWRRKAPALKPTKFMTNAEPLSLLLRKRCDQSHIHQPLVSGRCAAAAFYPLDLIRTFLKGIRATIERDEHVKGLVGPTGSNANREPDDPSCARSAEGKTTLVVEGWTRSGNCDSICAVVKDKDVVPWTSRWRPYKN